METQRMHICTRAVVDLQTRGKIAHIAQVAFDPQTTKSHNAHTVHRLTCRHTVCVCVCVCVRVHVCMCVQVRRIAIGLQ